jgi:hypothetical protein
VADLLLDPAKSRVRIRTFAEGLFAKLAHDLELECGKLEGRASRNDDSLSMGTATIDVPVSGIEVAGTLLKNDSVDEHGLSPSDRADCLSKMRKDVFQCGPSGTVRVHVVLDTGSARVKLVPPNGRGIERMARPAVTDEGDGRVRVKGALDVSLASIGSATVKGPMNAFRVKARVEVLFDVVFYPA